MEKLNQNLHYHSIEIKKETGFHESRNLCTGDMDYSPYEYFNIYYMGESVAQFRDNSFNPIPSLDYYAKLFKYGFWVNSLKNEINKIKKQEDSIICEKTDELISETIKKLIKELENNKRR